jgi:hypothetical protein
MKNDPYFNRGIEIGTLTNIDTTKKTADILVSGRPYPMTGVPLPDSRDCYEGGPIVLAAINNERQNMGMLCESPYQT